MNSRSKLHCACLLTKNERGAAALMMIVIVLAVIVLIVSSTVFIGLDDLEIGFSQQAGSHTLLAAESCAEETILRLSRDNSYAGGTMEVGDAICTSTVSGNPCGACTIAVTSIQDVFTRRLQVGVNIAGSDVTITSWEEVD